MGGFGVEIISYLRGMKWLGWLVLWFLVFLQWVLDEVFFFYGWEVS